MTESTQNKYPWRATIRTLTAYIVAVFGVIAVAVPIIGEEFGPILSERALAWITSITLIIGMLTSTVTRIMATPQIDELLDVVGLSSEPKRAMIESLESNERNSNEPPAN